MCAIIFFFKQKTAYEMRISDWSSDVCSSDLAVEEIVDVGAAPGAGNLAVDRAQVEAEGAGLVLIDVHRELRSVVESDRADLRDALVARRHAPELVARAEQPFVPHVGVVHQTQVEAERLAEERKTAGQENSG